MEHGDARDSHGWFVFRRPADGGPAFSIRLFVKNHLKELRASKDWSQGELAERLGVSRQTINAIETEKYDPSLPLAFKIARLFRRPIEEIFSDKG